MTTKVTSQAELFDRLASGPDLYVYEPESLSRLNGLIEGKGRVLDVGCGDGAIGAALEADAVIGFDVSRRCAARARVRGVTALVADALRGLPFEDKSFDTVYCVDVLHHLDHQWEHALLEFDRVLRPGGRLAIVEPDARNVFVRLTQAPGSPIRVAPWPNEPAIDPEALLPLIRRLGYHADCTPITIDGRQCVRSVFPMWQRLLKAPAVLALAWRYRKVPNKFAIVARKPSDAIRP